MRTTKFIFINKDLTVGILNHFESQQSLPAQVRAPDGELASDRSTQQGQPSAISTDNAEAATGQYRDYAGGATSLTEAQERAASSLISATLSRRLPILNIQYGDAHNLPFESLAVLLDDMSLVTCPNASISARSVPFEQTCSA